MIQGGSEKACIMTEKCVQYPHSQ